MFFKIVDEYEQGLSIYIPCIFMVRDINRWLGSQGANPLVATMCSEVVHAKKLDIQVFLYSSNSSRLCRVTMIIGNTYIALPYIKNI